MSCALNWRWFWGLGVNTILRLLFKGCTFTKSCCSFSSSTKPSSISPLLCSSNGKYRCWSHWHRNDNKERFGTFSSRRFKMVPVAVGRTSSDTQIVTERRRLTRWKLRLNFCRSDVTRYSCRRWIIRHRRSCKTVWNVFLGASPDCLSSFVN